MMMKKASKDHWDVIVIGSGIGGMSCANALSRTGKQVLILEQHYVPGGMTHVFKRKGFTWDVGVHALGEMSKKRIPGKVLSWLSNDQIKMNLYSDIYDTFHFPEGLSFELPSDFQQFEKNLHQAFPEESEAIHEYIKLVKLAAKSTRRFFASRSLPRSLEKLIGKFIRKDFDKWAKLTTKEVLDSLTSNEKLKSVLGGQWGYYGCPPSKSSFFIQAVTTRHFWEGAYYPVGKSAEIAKNLLAPLEEREGEIVLRAHVQKLLMENNSVIGVELKDGQKYYADVVVSAIGARASLLHLLPTEQREKSWAQNILKLKQSPCHLCMYIGLEGDITQTEATKSNQWIYETFDLEKCLWKFREEEEAPCLYVSFPSLKDPNHDPGEKQRHTAEVVTFVDWEEFSKWEDTQFKQRPEAYKELKEKLQHKMIAQMKKHYPKLLELMVYAEFSTPLSTTHFCQTDRGAIYGLEPTPERFQTPDLRAKTPLKNFYLSGGDIGTLGVVGAMMGGIVTASNIDKSIMKKIGK